MTDTDFLAAALKDGEWHSHSEILNRSLSLRGCGLTVHSRAADLRKRGHVVETRLERDGRGRTLSFYRLVLDEAVDSVATVRDGSRSTAVSSSTPLSNPAGAASLPRAESDDPTPPDRDGGGVLLLFDVHDQARVVRGAYSEDAA